MSAAIVSVILMAAATYVAGRQYADRCGSFEHRGAYSRGPLAGGL